MIKICQENLHKDLTDLMCCAKIKAEKEKVTVQRLAKSYLVLVNRQTLTGGRFTFLLIQSVTTQLSDTICIP
mgnify:CR=1 FL=1